MTDMLRANVAADYVINAMIAMRNRELKKEVFPFIEGVLLDEALSGDKSVEQLYRELSKPQRKEQPPEVNPKPSQPEPDEQDGDDGDDGEPDEQDGDDGDDGEPPEVNPKPSQPKPDKQDGDSDGVPEGADGDGDDGEPEGADGDGDKQDDDDLSDFVGTGAADNIEPEAEDGETQADVIDKIEEANDRILIADEIDRKQMADKGQTGQRVGGQRQHGSALGWPDLLRQWLTSKSRCGWDAPFNAPIYSTTGVVAAGRRNKKAGEIVMVIDTSGSIGQRTYDRFLQEAQAVLDDLKPERLHLLSVSHVLADVVTLEEGDAVPDKLKGGGGTAFKPAFDWVKDNVADMDVMVYLTDGWSNDLPYLPQVDFPLLWLTTQRAVTDFKIGEALAITEL